MSAGLGPFYLKFAAEVRVTSLKLGRKADELWQGELLGKLRECESGITYIRFWS